MRSRKSKQAPKERKQPMDCFIARARTKHFKEIKAEGPQSGKKDSKEKYVAIGLSIVWEFKTINTRHGLAAGRRRARSLLKCTKYT